MISFGFFVIIVRAWVSGNTTDLQTFLVGRSWNLQISPSSTSLNLWSYSHHSPAAPLPQGYNTTFLGKRYQTSLHARISGFLYLSCSSLYQFFKLSYCREFFKNSFQKGASACSPPILLCQNLVIECGIKFPCPQNDSFLGLTLFPFQALIFKN